VIQESQKAVLVVEDDADVRAAIGLLLETHGFPVIEAEHGAAALDALRGNHGVGVVLLDLMMPVMDGWTFRDLQRREPAIATVPVVVVSADATARDTARELRADAWIAKPVDFDRLVEVVRRYCSGR
jgi:CheY-like chemotaxis protein